MVIEVGKHLRYTANLALCFHKERPLFRTVSHITKNTTIGRFQRMMLYVVFNSHILFGDYSSFVKMHYVILSRNDHKVQVDHAYHQSFTF